MALLRVAGQFGGAVLGVGLAVDVGGRGVEEPLQALVRAARRDQRVGVGVEQARGGRAGAHRIQIRGLQGDDGLIELAQVHPGARHHDPQLAGLVTAEPLCFLAAAELDGPLRPTETTLAVRHHGQQPGTTRHAPRGPQLREGLGPLLGVIGHHTGGLADHRDATGPLPGGPGVGQRQPRIVLEQLDSHHHVPGDGLGVVLVQAQQIPAHGGIEIGGLHVLGQVGLVRAGSAPVGGTATHGASAFTATATILALFTGVVARVVAPARPVATAAVVSGTGTVTRVSALATVFVTRIRGDPRGVLVPARLVVGAVTRVLVRPGPAIVVGGGPLGREIARCPVLARGDSLRPLADEIFVGRRGTVVGVAGYLVRGLGTLARRRVAGPHSGRCRRGLLDGLRGEVGVLGVARGGDDTEHVAFPLAALLTIGTVQRLAVFTDIAARGTGITLALEAAATAIVVAPGTAIIVAPLVATTIAAVATTEPATIRTTARTVVTFAAPEATAIAATRAVVAFVPAEAGAATGTVFAVAPEPTTIATVVAAPRTVIAFIATEPATLGATARTVVTFIATEPATLGATARTVVTLVTPEPATLGTTTRTVIAFVTTEPTALGATARTVVVATEAAAVAGPTTARVVAPLVTTAVAAVAPAEAAAIVTFVPAEAGAATGAVVVVSPEPTTITTVVAAPRTVIAFIATEPATIRTTTGAIFVVATVATAVRTAIETTCGTVGFIATAVTAAVAGAAAGRVVALLVSPPVTAVAAAEATALVVPPLVAAAPGIVAALRAATVRTTTRTVVALTATEPATAGVVAPLVAPAVAAVATPEAAAVATTVPIVTVVATALALGAVGTATATASVVVAAESAALVLAVSAAGAVGRFAAPAETAGVSVPAERLPSVVVFRHGDPFLDSPSWGVLSWPRLQEFNHGRRTGHRPPGVAEPRSAPQTTIGDPNLGPLSRRYVRRCPTLPHPVECSTIGAGGLSFRVRNGTGRFPTAITAVTL